VHAQELEGSKLCRFVKHVLYKAAGVVSVLVVVGINRVPRSRDIQYLPIRS
jgi:hypothetical protein